MWMSGLLDCAYVSCLSAERKATAASYLSEISRRCRERGFNFSLPYVLCGLAHEAEAGFLSLLFCLSCCVSH